MFVHFEPKLCLICAKLKKINLLSKTGTVKLDKNTFCLDKTAEILRFVEKRQKIFAVLGNNI